MPAPINHGKDWTTRERAELMAMYRFGTSLKLMASELGRSEFAVECQLDSLKKGLKENTPSTRLLNPCSEIPLPKFCEQEPTEGQLKLAKFLEEYDGSEVKVRNIYTKSEYTIESFNPYVRDGVVTIRNPNGEFMKPSFHWVTRNCELIEEEEEDMKSRRITWMVSVDGMQAPKEQHSNPESAQDEAKRLAHKNPGKHVRVLRLEETYIAELKVRKL